MGIVKTFSEFIKEAFSSVKTLADNIYEVLEEEYSGNFLKPIDDEESPYLASILDAYNIEYDGDIFEIGFVKDNIFDNDDYVYYQIFVADNAPIDPDNGVNSSLWIEYGEKGFTDGPEPWCLWYDAENDLWTSNEKVAIDDEDGIINLLVRITSLVNPHTKYVIGYSGDDDKYSDDITYTFTIDLESVSHISTGEGYYDLEPGDQRAVKSAFKGVVSRVKADVSELKSKSISVEFKPELITISNVFASDVMYVTQKMIENWLDGVGVLYVSDIEAMSPTDEIEDNEPTLYDKWQDYLYDTVEH